MKGGELRRWACAVGAQGAWVAVVGAIALIVPDLLFTESHKNKLSGQAWYAQALRDYCSRWGLGCEMRFADFSRLAVFHSVLKAVIAAGLGWIAAWVGIAAVVSLSRRLAQWLDAALGSMRGIPSIAWMPLFVSFGWYMDLHYQIAFVVCGILPLVASQVSHSMLAITEERVQLQRNAGASRFQVALRLLIPGSVDGVFQGLRYGVALGFVLVLVYEWLWTDQFGVGRLMTPTEAVAYQRDAWVFLLLALAIGLALDRATVTVRTTAHYFMKIRARRSAEGLMHKDGRQSVLSSGDVRF